MQARVFVRGVGGVGGWECTHARMQTTKFEARVLMHARRLQARPSPAYATGPGRGPIGGEQVLQSFSARSPSLVCCCLQPVTNGSQNIGSK